MYESPNNEFYGKLCSCTVFWKLRLSCRKSSKYIQTPKNVRQQFSTTNPTHFANVFEEQRHQFCEKVTKTFSSADISMYKLNDKHIKNLFLDIGPTLLSETICIKTVPQLSADELERIRKAVHHEQIFLVLHESTLSGKQYLNILIGSLATPHVSYCQPPLCAPNNNSIAQAVDNAIRSLGIHRNSLCLLLSDPSKYMTAASAI